MSMILPSIKLTSCFTEVPYTLIRFQTEQKRNCFAPVFKKICVQTYRFRIVFVRPHYKAVSVLKTLSYAQCACTYELDAWALGLIYRPPKLAKNWSHMVASVPHFGFSRWGGLRPVASNLMTSPFSDSIVFPVHTTKQRFQEASFSNHSTLESVFEWLSFRWSFSAL